MEEYKKAVAHANSERLLHFWKQADGEYNSIVTSLEDMIKLIEYVAPKVEEFKLKGKVNRELEKALKNLLKLSDRIQKSYEKLDECVEMGGSINDAHSYYFQMVEKRDAAKVFHKASDYLYKGMTSDTKYFSNALKEVTDYSTKAQNRFSKGVVTSADKNTESVRRKSMESADKFKNNIGRIDSKLNTNNMSRSSSNRFSRTNTETVNRSTSTSRAAANNKTTEIKSNTNEKAVGAKAKANYE